MHLHHRIAARLTTAAFGTAERLGAAIATFGTAERLRRDDGASTAEYAIVMMAAVGFAGLLVVILRSDGVRETLTNLVENALSAAG